MIYGDLKNRILRTLKDPTGTRFSADLLLDSIQAAHDAILPWYPKRAISTTAIVGDGSATAFTLPADLYWIEAIQKPDTGELIPPATLDPGVIRGAKVAENDWLEFPHGSVTFSLPPGASDAYVLYYLAEWAKPATGATDNDPLEPPDFLLTSMGFYGSAYCLNPDAVSAANIRQFNSKIDSGNPEHNPMADRVNFLLTLFRSTMNTVPAVAKATRI